MHRWPLKLRWGRPGCWRAGVATEQCWKSGGMKTKTTPTHNKEKDKETQRNVGEQCFLYWCKGFNPFRALLNEFPALCDAVWFFSYGIFTAITHLHPSSSVGLSSEVLHFSGEKTHRHRYLERCQKSRHLKNNSQINIRHNNKEPWSSNGTYNS